MTFVGTLVAYYVRFSYTWTLVGIGMGILNFGMIMYLFLKGKGIDIPTTWMAILLFAMITGGALLGEYLERVGFWNKINSHANQKMNPEIKSTNDMVTEIHSGVVAIRKQIARSKLRRR